MIKDKIPPDTQADHFIDKLAYFYTDKPRSYLWWRIKTRGNSYRFPNGDIELP